MGRSKGLMEEEAVDYRDSGLKREFLELLNRNRELYRPSKDEEEYKEINKKMAGMLAMVGHKTVLTPDWRTTFVAGSHSYVDPKKLLALGVPVKVIKKATVTTTWESVTVTAVKNGDEQ